MACKDDCIKCKEVINKYRIRTKQPNAFIVCLDTSLFEAVEKRERLSRRNKKRRILRNLSAIACALRNTEGGSILVHLQGQEGNRYLGFFDEFVTDTFTYLIEDGNLYVHTYSRVWLDTLGQYKDNKGFICINVDKSSGVSIVDFCSNIRNDFEIIRPLPINILSLLRSLGSRTKETEPVVRGIDLAVLQECRNVEFKSVSHCAEIIGHKKVVDFVKIVWDKLKLKLNITSMSKIDGGGSFFVGIAESKENSSNCNIKPVLEGFRVCAPLNEYIKKIRDKIQSEISVLNKDLDFAEAPENLVTPKFHELEDEKYILEICIRYFDGLVFYDKEGPLAYVIQGGEIKRMSKEEILDKAKSQYHIKREVEVTQCKNDTKR